MKIICTFFSSVIFMFLLVSNVLAHPGRTSSDGCHYCRTNCDSWGVPWNVRHCHGGYSDSANNQPSIIAPTKSPIAKPTKSPAPKPTDLITGSHTSSVVALPSPEVKGETSESNSQSIEAPAAITQENDSTIGSFIAGSIIISSLYILYRKIRRKKIEQNK